MESDSPLILTLKFDPETFARLDGLRRAHFPAARNFIPAHLTLFHALPAVHEIQIRENLANLAAETAVFELSFSNLRFLGKGVAIDVQSAELADLRQRLAQKWSAWLTAQDRQQPRPHVTIQNKVAPDAARQLFDSLSVDFEPFAGRGEGLLLWRYLGGPWEAAGEFLFEDLKI